MGDPVHDLTVAVGLDGTEFKRLAFVICRIARESGKSMN